VSDPPDIHADRVRAWAEDERRIITLLARGHYLAGKKLERDDRRIGYAVTLLSALTSSTIFGSLATDERSTPAVVLVGLVALVTAMLSGIRSTGRMSERSEKHKVAGATFDELQADAHANVVAASGTAVSTEYLEAATKDLHRRRAAATRAAPDLPDRFYEAARREPVGGDSPGATLRDG